MIPTPVECSLDVAGRAGIKQPGWWLFFKETYPAAYFVKDGADPWYDPDPRPVVQTYDHVPEAWRALYLARYQQRGA